MLSPDQTDSQVVASWKLGSTWDSVRPGLAWTCVDLRWFAITLVVIKFARKSMQVFYRLATQPASLFASSTCRYLRVRLTRALYIQHVFIDVLNMSDLIELNQLSTVQIICDHKSNTSMWINVVNVCRPGMAIGWKLINSQLWLKRIKILNQFCLRWKCIGNKV